MADREQHHRDVTLVDVELAHDPRGVEAAQRRRGQPPGLRAQHQDHRRQRPGTNGFVSRNRLVTVDRRGHAQPGRTLPFGQRPALDRLLDDLWQLFDTPGVPENDERHRSVLDVGLTVGGFFQPPLVCGVPYGHEPPVLDVER